MQPFPEKILAVSRRLMNTFLAVSENFPAAAGGYRERAVSGPLLSYTPSRMWMRLLAYTFSIKLAQNSFHVSTPAVYVMFLHLIALLAIRIPCDTASSSENFERRLSFNPDRNLRSELNQLGLAESPGAHRKDERSESRIYHIRFLKYPRVTTIANDVACNNAFFLC